MDCLDINICTHFYEEYIYYHCYDDFIYFIFGMLRLMISSNNDGISLFFTAENNIMSIERDTIYNTIKGKKKRNGTDTR